MSWKIPATLFFLEPTVGQEKKMKRIGEKRELKREREKRQDGTLNLC
jgi:hypothetical protein